MVTRAVFHKTRYKDGRPVTDPKEKGGEEVHEHFVIDAIDANDAVARFPKHYSFDHPGEGAKVVRRQAATPFAPTQGLAETGEGTNPPPGTTGVDDSEDGDNAGQRASLVGEAAFGGTDPVDREPLIGGRSRRDSNKS